MEVTTTQAALLIGKSERTIQRWIMLKKLIARELTDGRYMVNTADLEPFMQQSDETLLARVETLEQEVEDLERQIEALEHRPATIAEPAGKKGQKKIKKKSMIWNS